MNCPVRGGLAIDILKGNRVGGIEFLNAVFERPTWAEALKRTLWALAASHRIKCAGDFDGNPFGQKDHRSAAKGQAG